MEARIAREIDEKEGLLQDLEEAVDLKLQQLKHHKNTLIRGREYCMKFADSESFVIENLSFEINRGDRVAISGKNGCGKSSLIKSILQKNGMNQTDFSILENGVCELASGLVISYVGQRTSNLQGDITSFCLNHGLDRSLFCTILRQLDMERVQFLKNMEEYSEGQKKKVLLAASLLKPAHIFIWDEPLNYIDVFSRMQIEKLLLEHQPTMLFVEHDVRFREKIATKMIEL